MSDIPISKMNDKELRNEVQSLRDELAIMKREYEDIIYNLDTDNFSSRFTREQKNMKSAIEFTAEGIKTKVSKEEMETFKESTITQTATQIKTAVESVTNETDKKLENYATVEITDEKISASVKETKEYAEEYVTDILANGDYVTNATFKSQFDLYADGIYATVEETYETKDDANSKESSLRSSISSVSIEADNISSRVGSLENGEYGEYTLFEQTGDTFLFDGEKTTFTGVVFLTDNSGNKRFSINHDESQGYEQVIIGSYGNSLPIVIGDAGDSVYVGGILNGYEVATRQWVLDNAGSAGGTVVAVFG